MRITKQSNIFGGEDVFENGQFIGRTKQNIFGGNNFFDENGNFAGSSRESITGSVDYHSSNGELSSTTKDLLGGNTAIYDGTGSYQSFVSAHGDMKTVYDSMGELDFIISGESILPSSEAEIDILSLIDIL